MTQDVIANFYTFSDANGTIQIKYYPYARLEYQGPEGQFGYPSASPGRDKTTQEQSFLGKQVTVVLMPSVEGPAVTLTLLLPSITMADQDEQKFDTIAIKTTTSGILPTGGGAAHLRSDLLTGQSKTCPPSTRARMGDVSARRS